MTKFSINADLKQKDKMKVKVRQDNNFNRLSLQLQKIFEGFIDPTVVILLSIVSVHVLVSGSHKAIKTIILQQNRFISDQLANSFLEQPIFTRLKIQNFENEDKDCSS